MMNGNIGELILIDREKRQETIKTLLTKGSVVSIKANFPSTDKNDYLAWMLVAIFDKVIDHTIDKNFILDKTTLNGYDGRTVLYLLTSRLDTKIVKNALIEIEEHHPLGRYIDLDVYDNDTKQSLSRGFLRKCILCDKPAIVCMREHHHEEYELIDQIEADVKKFLEIEVKKNINYASLLELNLKYKFGLVTPYHAHKDMDTNLMKRAINVLIYPFLEMFDLGFEVDTIEELNHYLHEEGKRAEYLMYKETKGVNCYKGLIFLLGLFLGAYSYSLSKKQDFKEVLKELNKNVLDDYQDSSLITFGAKAYHEYGLLGARGEAYNGFPHVFSGATYLNQYTDDELYTLLIYLVKTVDDTVLLKRSGSIEKYHYYKELIGNIDPSDLEKIQEITLDCERENISIGGCADIFVLSVFYSLMNKMIDILHFV